MTNPSPSGPKALRRSRRNRYIGGVCGGVADYLNMDPTLVRILTVVITFFTGVPAIAYLVALLVMPEEDSAPTWTYGPYTPPPSAQPPADDVWGPAGPPWAGGTTQAEPSDPVRKEDHPA